MAGISLQQCNPALLLKEITDIYARTNFENLGAYFRANNQLLNFKFFEVVFDSATTNYKLAHGLGLVPQDIIVTKGVGSGSVYFNHGLFTSTHLDITVTAACRIRFFVGVYWNFQSTVTPATTDKQLLNLDAASSTSSSLPSGIVLDWAGASLPSWGALWCDGASYLISAYPSLYAAIGWTYGKVDIDHFSVPDRRGRMAVGRDGMGSATAAGRVTSAVSGIDGATLGAVGGAQSVTLDTTMIPAHSHTQDAHNHTQNAHTHTIVLWGAAPAAVPTLLVGTTTPANSGTPDANYFQSTVAVNQATTATNQNTGGGLAHNNMPPSQVTNFIIKT